MLSILILLHSASLLAWEPVFQKPFKIICSNDASVMSDSLPLDHADPCFADWDGDNLTDMIVGEFDNGNISWWKNTGSVGAPKFDIKRTYLEADGKRISVKPL